MKYPIGIQDFEKLRTEGNVYVDKTALIHKLVHAGSYYFLSRPRRFGKSLLITTLEAYFLGKKELFQGLAMEKLETEWAVYPVLHLDLNTGKYVSPESLEERLDKTLTLWEGLYGKGPAEPTQALRFEGIIQRACEKTGKRVVILVDEYDKPMLQAIGNEELLDDFRCTLKAFYSVLKSQDKYIKFAFLTGVTKFSKVSVFSDLNNLQDLSMDERFVEICGLTEKELHEVFPDSVKEVAAINHITVEECYAQLKKKFDGYHFEHDTMGIYNPFSILNTFEKRRFKDYWFESGTPTFLVELMKKSNYRLDRLQQEEITSDMLGSIDSIDKYPVPIIYQSGYLSIKGYDERFNIYKLGFPNEEVENGFISYLLPHYTPKEENSAFCVTQFINDVENGDAEGFLECLQTFFDDNSYQVAGKMELYFQNTMYVIFKMMGFYTEVERATSKGRIDITLKTNDYIYIIELKLDGSAESALEQIDAKGYAKPFAHDPRKLFKIGINFSSATRGIEEWKIEE